MQWTVAALQRIDWEDVRVFLAVARSQALGPAARQLEVDKATVSRRIAALEKRLKTRLFLRTREGLRLSASAEALVGPATAMESAARQFEEASRVVDAEVAGAVRLATTEALASRLVSAGLLELTRQYPLLELELSGGNRSVDLTRGEADLALRLSAPQQQSLTGRIVARLKVAVFASTAYLERRGTPPNPQRLEGHDVLVPSGELGALPESRWLAGRPGVRVAFRSSSMGALLEGARAGFGLAPLTAAWGDAEPGLTRLFDVPSVAARPVWLLSTRAGLLRPAVRVVADQVAQIMGRLSKAGGARP